MTRRANRGPHFDCQAFLIGFVQHVQNAKAPTAIERVVHEIKSPDFIDASGRNEWLAKSWRDAPSCSARQIQPHRAIYTQDRS